MQKLILFGTGQVGEILCHYFKHDSPYQIAAFTADAQFIQSPTFHGLPVVPFEEIEKEFSPRDFHMHIALSYADLNLNRERKFIAAKEKGYALASYVSSKAGIFGKLEHGENCVVMENQFIQPYSKLGNNVAIWSGVLVGHHAVVEDHCWLTSGAAVGGNARIGSRTFLGMNSTVGHMVTLGRECFLGAGTLVTKSAPDYSVFVEKDTEKFRLDSRHFLRITKMK